MRTYLTLTGVPALLSSLVLSSPTPPISDAGHINGICTPYTITETVTSTNVMWANPPLLTNLDVAQLLANVSGMAKNPASFNPFTGSKNETQAYTLSATFCTPKVKKGKEETVLLATHGFGYNGRYWDSGYKPETYSFVWRMLDEGYSVLWYDRLGLGNSERLSGYVNQASMQSALLTRVAERVKEGAYTADIRAKKLVLVGHSYGSLMSSSVLATRPDLPDALILTGWAYPNATDISRINSFYTLTNNAARLGPSTFPEGYLANADMAAHATAFFHQPYEFLAAAYAYSISSPGGILEYLTGRTVLVDSAPEFKGDVLLASGEYDVLGCDNECESTFMYGRQDEVFNGAKRVQTWLQPGAGHGGNFARSAPELYGRIAQFLEEGGF